MYLIEVKDVYAKNNRGGSLCGMSFLVKKKGIYGVLGAYREDLLLLGDVICGCSDITAGEITVGENKICRADVESRRRVRLVPEKLNISPMATSADYLDFVGSALGIVADKRYRQVKEALELVGLDDASNRPFFRLDANQRFRLSLASSLMGNPECIVIADALRHVSPAEINEISEILNMLGSIKTVILLSANSDTVKRLCDEMTVISGGKAALSGSIKKIERKLNSTKELNITVKGDPEVIIKAICRGVEAVVGAKIITAGTNGVNTLTVEYRPDTKIKDKLYDALSAVNAPMLSYREISLSLEDVYLSLTAEDRKREENDKLSDINAKLKKGEKKK